jgi:hypothetical protein
MSKNKFAAWLSIALLATAVACGGGGSARNEGAQQPAATPVRVFIDASASYIKISDVAPTNGVSITFAGSAITPPALGSTQTLPYGGTALTYDATKGTFTGYIDAAANTTWYYLTVVQNAAGVVLGVATGGPVTVPANGFTNLSINVPSAQELLPGTGFFISGLQVPGYTARNTAANVSVSVMQPTPTPPATADALTYKWTVTPSACGGFGSPDTSTSASATFTPASTPAPGFQGVCTFKVVVTDATAGTTGNKSAAMGVATTIAITGTFIPSPTVTQIVLASEGIWTVDSKGFLQVAAESCTINRATSGSTATGSTCPTAFRVGLGGPRTQDVPVGTTPGAIDPPMSTVIGGQVRVGVAYDLGNLAPGTTLPTAGLDVDCGGTNGVSTYTAASPLTGSAYQVTLPTSAPNWIGSTELFWAEPLTAAVAGTFCKLTVTVNNLGALDVFPVWLLLTP